MSVGSLYLLPFILWFNKINLCSTVSRRQIGGLCLCAVASSMSETDLVDLTAEGLSAFLSTDESHSVFSALSLLVGHDEELS